MNAEIIYNMSMDSDFESDWFPINSEGSGSKSSSRVASSLQVTWDNVSGILNGKIEVLSSNDAVSQVVGYTLNINTNSNIEDSELLILQPGFNFIKLKYNKNGILNGILNAVLTYM
jgi:hypothetical protein